MSKATLAERFWVKVNKDGPIPAHMLHLGPCWVWTGAHRKTRSRPRPAYGMLSSTGLSTDNKLSAHRLSWEWAYGPVPTGLQVCHHCDNTLCVRPSHLFLGTAADNVHDRMAKGRPNPGRSKLTPEQVEEVRRLRASGVMVKDIAVLFAVVPSTIVHIMKGRSWNHVVPHEDAREELPGTKDNS